MEAYTDIVKNVLATGTRKENRTGVDTISTFHHSFELGFGARMVPEGTQGHYHLGEGFPLLTTKTISWKNIVVEMLWFLSGQTDISILKRHGCKFWDAWADENGKVPSAYGNFWRNFPVHGAPIQYSSGGVEVDIPIAGSFNDQIRWVLGELRKNPMSRRLVVTAWAPGNAQVSKLPPCHMQFIMNVQNQDDGQRLCLHMTQRSCDVALGVPYNIASYALLLHLFSRFSGIKPGIFAHTLVDSHIYTAKPDGSMAEFDHIPGLKEQITREPRPLPRLLISDEIKDLGDIEALMHPSVSTEEVMKHFVLEGYNPHPEIKFKVAV